MSKTTLPVELAHIFASGFSSENVSSIKLAKSTPEWDGRTSTVIVTDDCNLRCTYCYCNHEPVSMTWETAKQFIDNLFEQGLEYSEIPKNEHDALYHRKIFEFIGGEPLLESPLMFQCMDYITKRIEKLPNNHPWKRTDWLCDCGANHDVGYKFQIGTNGLLLNDKNIQERLLQYDGRVLSIAVTLDGPKEMHDLCRVTASGAPSWEQVMNARKWMDIHFPQFNLNTKSTIAHENVGYVSEIVRFFYGIGATSLSQNCVFEDVWRDGDQLILFDQLCHAADFLIEDKKYEHFYVRWFDPNMFNKRIDLSSWCGAGTFMDACDHSGAIYPCLRFKTLSQRTPFVVGNVVDGKSQTLVDMFKECKYSPESQTEVTGVNCEDCQVSALCADCKAYSYDCYGRLDVKAAFICPMHKAAVCANIYFFSKILGTEIDRDYLLYLLAEWTKNDHFYKEK